MSKLTELATEYLNRLQGYNLYNPKNIYELESSALNNTLSTVISGVKGNSIDFSNTILGRVLLPNTPLQKIANVELARNLALRVADNLRTEVLPTINQKGLGISFNKPNYWSISAKDKSFSTLVELLTGYSSSSNPLDLQPDNRKNNGEASSNFLKENRGQGQKDAYKENISRNNYSPDDKEKQYGDDWLSRNNILKGTATDSILYKTNKILKDIKLDKNGYGNELDSGYIGNSLTPYALAYLNNTDLSDPERVDGYGSGKLISRGDGTFTDSKKDKFLRVFNKNNPYSSTADLMKFNHPVRTNSVLQTVYPNIAPRHESDVKNLMFSIENLAFKDRGFELVGGEKGANGGRMMWFPPYGLSLNESIAANWNTVDFIGRSEPIYTYNGRERSMNITFQLLVDYPRQLNNYEWENNEDNEYAKFFRQDNGDRVNKNYSVGKVDKLEVERLKQTELPKQIPVNNTDNPFSKDNPLLWHFDNNVWDLNAALTQDNSKGDGATRRNDFNTRIEELIKFLNTKEGQQFKVKIGGFASTLATNKYNEILSFFRAKSVYNRIFNSLENGSEFALRDYGYDSPETGTYPVNNQYKNKKFDIAIYGDKKATNKNATLNTVNKDVVDRKVMLYLEFDANLSEITTSKEDEDTRNKRIETQRRNEVKLIESTIATPEHKYFERYPNVQRNDGEDNGDTEIIMTNYRDKIKYFSPVFHSQTPQDFNTRLTFLQQCTLQGKSINTVDNKLEVAPNSIFGKPPVCVLRIGDFFHTQIIITSVNISYDPLVWDTNPEGIGMQPMFAEITMECKVLGGQSLHAPLVKLQNALDYNFYANTEVYNDIAKKSADNEAKNKKTEPEKSVEPKKEIQQEPAQAITVNPVTGEVSTKNQTIDYTVQLENAIEYLRYWTGDLEVVYSTGNAKDFEENGYLNITYYQDYFNRLSPDLKEAEKQTFGVVNTYYVRIKDAMNNYDTIMAKLKDILDTGEDGKKVLQEGIEMDALDTIYDMLVTFRGTYIGMFENNRKGVKSELSKINKYLSGFIKPIPFI